MQTLAWEQLFRAIPERYHNNLSITTRAGVEITVQTLLRLDPECVAIRGRLAGSQDAGRVFFIPYEQIDHLGFLREMKEVEFAEIFETMQLPARPGSVAPAVQPVPVPEETVLIPTTQGTSPASRMSIPIKSEVLERFRSRTVSGTGTPTLNGRPGTTESSDAE